jgi:predicted TIM-barrel fold metal-dependent hydrolase
MSSTRLSRPPGAGRIDVHHHLCPPAYADEVNRIKPVFKALLDWSPERSLEDMDRGAVGTSIVSMTTPGLWFGDDGAARRLCRGCNEYSARMASDHPGRFGFFAALPLPDIEGSLREAEYALDELKADGVALFTSYQDKYLGDAHFHPLLAELHRRKAVAYTHPTVSDCWINLVPEVSEATIEYGTDTTRTIASLVFSGTASRYRDIRFIFSHAGGTMPFLMSRFLQNERNRARRGLAPSDPEAQVRRFFYDTAQSCHPAVMAALRQVADHDRILFGTDFPWGRADEHAAGLATCGLVAAELEAIGRGNAVRLLSRFHDHAVVMGGE